MEKIPLIILVTIVLFVTASAQKEANEINSKNVAVDGYVKTQMQRWEIPGIALAIIKNNKVIKEDVYGFANLDHNIPLTKNSIFPIASIDKQIIATCIMMLYEQGKLNLNDPISRYLDSLPEGWENIQIKHLLSHTSGLPHTTIELFKGRPLIVNTTEEIFENIKKQKLVSKSGESFLYTDAGYFLLQLIVQKVSGMDYELFLKKNILEPVGMNATQPSNPFKVTPGRVTNYFKNPEGEIQINIARYINSGPLLNDLRSTIPDFVKYDVAINTNKLLKRSTYEIMWTPFLLNNGSAISNLHQEKRLIDADASYGFGWELQEFKGYKIVYHSGFTGTSITKLPDENLTVILFSNLTDRGGYSANVLARHIAAFYVPESSPFGLKPKKDSSPDTIKLIEQQIKNLNKGVIESGAFTPEFLKLLTPALADYNGRIKRLGLFQSLEFLENVKVSDKKSRLYYKGNYENGVLFYQLTLTADKKIDFISVER